MIMHPQVTWQCIFPVADVISHKNMPTSSPQLVSQSIVSIASVVFLQFLMLSSCGVKWFQIEILWIESLLEMLLHCHSPARALVCKHVSSTNDLRQLCHLRHLDVCRSMFCLDVSRRGCSASTSSMTRSWWVQLLWINSVDSSPSCNCSILEPGPCVGGGNFGSKFAGFTASFILVNWWIRQLNFVKLCQLCHLFAMMSVPVADGSLPIVVLPFGIIHEACLIDWSAFWVVCTLYKIDKGLLVWSELLAGHCISWAGSSGEMAKVQGEPWFK